MNKPLYLQKQKNICEINSQLQFHADLLLTIMANLIDR